MRWIAIPPTLGPGDKWQIRNEEGELICIFKGDDDFQERNAKLVADMVNLANAEWTPPVTDTEAVAAVSERYPEDEDA